MSKQDEFDRQLDGTTPRPVAPPTDPAQPHPKQKEALETFAKFQKNRRMGISVDIKGIAGQLKLAEPRSTFPEELFVLHFLPLFADEVAATPELNIRTWIEKVAGSDHTPVDILAADGTVLFTVPPILDTSVLEQVKAGGVSMTRVERHYSRLKEIDAMASQTFLSKTLQGMHIKDKPTQEVYDNMKTWNQIFERYGKSDKIINLLDLNNDPNPKKENVSGSGGVGPSSADVSDYELDLD
jgi:hypothetical protein